MHSHRQITRRRTRIAQIVAVIGIGGASAIAVLPLQKAFTPAPPASVGVHARPGEASTEPEKAPAVDLAFAGDVLAAVGPEQAEAPADKPTDQSETPKTNEPEEPEPATAHANGGRWHYIGAIVSPAARHAILKDSTGQRMVAEGGDLGDGYSVVAVATDHVILEHAGARTRIDVEPMAEVWSTGEAAHPGVQPPVTARTPRVAPARPQPNRAYPRGKRPNFDPAVVKELREKAVQGQLQPEEIQTLRKKGLIDEQMEVELIKGLKEQQSKGSS